jgi:hypothetical protein
MENSYSKCKNIKSKRNPKTRCPNIATHGDYCGVHYKYPNPWTPTALSPGKIHRMVKQGTIQTAAAVKIQQWIRKSIGRYNIKTRGPAYFSRSLCVNDVDFFSTDPVADISGNLFFSYKDDKQHIYGFDLRSIATLIINSTDDEKVENPFNRDLIPLAEVRKVQKLVRKRTAHGMQTEWAKLEPSTPIQQYRMKIVDLFQIIDELNYYSSPEWFLELTLEGQQRFYRQLYAIWTYRANLIPDQKRQIVPNYTTVLFKYSPFVIATFPLERIQKINMNTIRTMITSAEDRNDRILGAMYIISTLTLVSDSARQAYPWLYESVVAPEDMDTMPPPAPLRFFGLGGWLNDIFNLTGAQNMPPLLLPPPQNTME